MGLRSVSLASRLTIHVRDDAWETRSVMRSAFFILEWLGVIEGREWGMLLLINASGDLSVDHLVAGDKGVVAFEDFVLNEGINTVSLAPLFGVFLTGF